MLWTLIGLFLGVYVLGWLMGAVTGSAMTFEYIKSKTKAQIDHELRQKKIQALYPTKYGDME